MNQSSKRSLLHLDVPILLYALFASFSLVAGFVLAMHGSFENQHVIILLMWPAACLVVYLIAVSIFAFIDNRLPREVKHVITGRHCVIGGVLIFVCWIPVLLAGFPGFFSYDAGIIYLGQWSQIESGVLNAHHPVLHTMFLDATIKLGQALFGTFNAGVCVSVVIQAFCVAVMCASVLRWLTKNGMGPVGFLLTAAYYALDPIIAMFAFCTTKDVFCSVCLVTLCLVMGSMLKNRAASLKQLIAVGVLTFLTCALRANAIIVTALLVVAYLFFADAEVKKPLIACLSAGLVAAIVWLGPIATAIGVQSSPIGSWNMLGVPMQQLSLCTVDNRVGDDDKEMLKESIPGILYYEGNSDLTRDAFMRASHKGGIAGFAQDYLGMYLKYGLKYPLVYIDAFLLHTQDAWSPFAVIDDGGDNDGFTDATAVFECEPKDPATLDSKLSSVYEFLHAVSRERGIESVPIVGLIVSIAFYLQAVVLCIVRSASKGRRWEVLMVMPLALMALSNLFGPCMLIRYYLYLFLALPILLFLIIRPKADANREASGRSPS